MTEQFKSPKRATKESFLARQNGSSLLKVGGPFMLAAYFFLQLQSTGDML